MNSPGKHFNSAGNEVFYKGKSIFKASSAVLNLIETSATTCVLFLKYVRGKIGQSPTNILMIDSRGNLLWTIKPTPSGSQGFHDYYVDMKLDKGIFRVWTYSCLRYDLDPKTGALSNEIFTK